MRALLACAGHTSSYLKVWVMPVTWMGCGSCHAPGGGVIHGVELRQDMRQHEKRCRILLCLDLQERVTHTRAPQTRLPVRPHRKAGRQGVM